MDALEGEEWRTCARDARYRVSSEGRVLGARGRLLQPRPNDRGYLTVDLGRRRPVYVHQLVAEAFLPPAPEGHDTVEHKGVSGTNDKRDNRAVNLAWLPLKVNSAGWHATRGIVWDGRIDGRNVWTNPDRPPQHYPDDSGAQTLTEEELRAAGWN